MERIETIKTIIEKAEILTDFEPELIASCIEYSEGYKCEITADLIEEIIEKIEDGYYTYFASWEDYYDFCDETLDFSGASEFMTRYFDYEQFHRDCRFDACEYGDYIFLG